MGEKSLYEFIATNLNVTFSGQGVRLIGFKTKAKML